MKSAITIASPDAYRVYSIREHFVRQGWRLEGDIYITRQYYFFGEVWYSQKIIKEGETP